MIPTLGTSFYDVSPEAFLTILATFAFILGIAVAVKLLIKREPPLHREFVAQGDCEKQHTEVRTALARDAFARKGIYESLTAQGVDIAGVKIELGAHTNALSDLKQQITRTEDRIGVMDGHAADRTEELRKELKADIGGVHERINLVLAGVARLEGKVSK
jgi:hypothetical protein